MLLKHWLIMFNNWLVDPSHEVSGHVGCHFLRSDSFWACTKACLVARDKSYGPYVRLLSVINTEGRLENFCAHVHLRGYACSQIIKTPRTIAQLLSTVHGKTEPS
jgi:hypothetical protein